MTQPTAVWYTRRIGTPAPDFFGNPILPEDVKKSDTIRLLTTDTHAFAFAPDGAPSNESIGNGTYPLTNDFYVVIRKSAAADSPERVLYNWICSDQGRRLVLNENYPVRADAAKQ